MLEYDRIDTSKGIDIYIYKTNASRECDICHYWYNYEPYLCNGCHDLMQKAMNFNVAIFSIKGNDYGIHFWYMTKDDAISIMNNSNLSEKTGLL